MNTYYRVQSGDRDAQDLITDATSTDWSDSERIAEGVSVCSSLEDLATYLATDGQGIPFGDAGWVLVELEGEYIADGHDGEPLVIPTAITSVAPISDEFFDMVGAAFDAQ